MNFELSMKFKTWEIQFWFPEDFKLTRISIYPHLDNRDPPVQRLWRQQDSKSLEAFLWGENTSYNAGDEAGMRGGVGKTTAMATATSTWKILTTTATPARLKKTTVTSEKDIQRGFKPNQNVFTSLYSKLMEPEFCLKESPWKLKHLSGRRILDCSTRNKALPQIGKDNFPFPALKRTGFQVVSALHIDPRGPCKISLQSTRPPPKCWLARAGHNRLTSNPMLWAEHQMLLSKLFWGSHLSFLLLR